MSSVISYDFIMDNNKIQLIGAPCGHHGPYTFYKAFKYNKNGKCRILALSDFFFVKLWSDSDLMSIGELQLLWMDKNSEQVLASLRLYFLPENTPEGRSDDHGEVSHAGGRERLAALSPDHSDKASPTDDGTLEHG
ncbi:AT-rich interactive domain-containing protein 5B-like [Schistocerca americana]|uniref:AT-rich interactive domain-containing protein 5B-like n=1 Tax=Schistocerca americana TaxID=7009 RepID=UPI001F4F4997|nr:AT-rich interactive domain-containing protein 5B-like [Schistocerca americana]